MAEGEQPEEPELERAAGDLPPEPTGISLPWRELVGWIVAVAVVLWALILLPGIVRQIQVIQEDPEWTASDAIDAGVELPPDPPLSPKVQELMRRGVEAEDAQHFVEARALYDKATKLEKKCSSCYLRLYTVERRIEALGLAALEEGNRYLAEARYEEAARSYQKVLNLVPSKKANFHVLAEAGLRDAKAAAAKIGRPIP